MSTVFKVKTTMGTSEDYLVKFLTDGEVDNNEEARKLHLNKLNQRLSSFLNNLSQPPQGQSRAELAHIDYNITCVCNNLSTLVMTVGIVAGLIIVGVGLNSAPMLAAGLSVVTLSGFSVLVTPQILKNIFGEYLKIQKTLEFLDKDEKNKPFASLKQSDPTFYKQLCKWIIDMPKGTTFSLDDTTTTAS